MQEFDTYLMILDEGQEKHAKKMVLLLGEKKLGAPDPSVARTDQVRLRSSHSHPVTVVSNTLVSNSIWRSIGS